MTWRPEKLTRVQLTERRQAGATMLESGQWSQAAIARELGVSEAAVSKWKSKLESKGRRALDALPVPGRPAKLTDPQQRQLLRVLKRGAQGWLRDGTLDATAHSAGHSVRIWRALSSKLHQPADATAGLECSATGNPRQRT